MNARLVTAEPWSQCDTCARDISGERHVAVRVDAVTVHICRDCAHKLAEVAR